MNHLLPPKDYRQIQFLLLTFAFCLLSACSDDNNSGTETSEQLFPFNFSVISRNEQAVYHLDFSRNSLTPETINLTQTLGVPADYTYFQNDKTLLSFHKWASGNLPVWEKNIETGETFTTDLVCSRDELEATRFPEVSKKWLINFTSEPGDRESIYYARVLNRATGSCKKVFLFNGIWGHRNVAVINGDFLYVYYQGSTGHEIIEFNLNTGQEVNRLAFNQPFQGFADNGKLYILLGSVMKVYNTNGLEYSADVPMEPRTNNGQGVFYKNIYEGKMVFDIWYPQPGPVEKGPAVVDFSTGTVINGMNLFMLDINMALSREISGTPEFTTYEVDLPSNTILIGFRNMNTDKGGLLYTNFEGEIFQLIELDETPQEIIIK